MRALAIVVALAGCWSKPLLPANDHLDDDVLLAAGDKHACSIDSGVLSCWGNNDHHQLGQSSVPMTGTPVLAAPAELWRSVAAGARHTCALTSQNELFCWGDGSDGQVSPSLDAASAPTKITLPRGTPSKVFAGSTSTCVIDFAGRLYCWGTINTVLVTTPQQIMPGHIATSWRSVAIAGDHACAIHDNDNLVYCWGKDDAGQLGVDNDRTVDDASPTGRELVAISASHRATCGITIDRDLVCFGDNARGLIGPSPMPTKDVIVDARHRWTALALGAYHTCAIGDGGVNCFGSDDSGALGDGFDARVALPTSALLAARHVVAGDGFSCAIDAVAVVSCWGSNAYGELGNGQIATKRTPTRVVAVGPTGIRVSVGRGHSCAIMSDQHAYCWGDDRKGQVTGTPSTVGVTPTRLGTETYNAIALGAEHTCVINAASTTMLRCWGAHQLGTPDGTITSDTVFGVSMSPAWLSISSGRASTCASNANGTIACWGDLPGVGALGGLALSSNPPSYASVAVGDGFAIAATTTGTPTNVDQMGAVPCNPAMTFPNSTPIQTGGGIGSNTDGWTVAAAQEGKHACALDVHGGVRDLFCWGDNKSGQVGVAGSACEVPRSITAPAGTQWSDGHRVDGTEPDRTIAVATDHTCAIDFKHDVYCWGANPRGELAELADSSIPHLIAAGLEHFDAIATGPHHTCALDTLGPNPGIYCWGENKYGELGDGESFHPEPHAIVAPQ